jgi:hypothetical protein
MPQGNVVDENGKEVWPYDICCEFDCNVEFANKQGCDCKGDFTNKPCMFNGEHRLLNLKEEF